MKTKLVLKKGLGYHDLSVDGMHIASIWGVAVVTDREYMGTYQVSISHGDAFVWVNEIVQPEDDEDLEKKLEVKNEN